MTPLMPGADGEPLQVGEVLRAPAAEPEQRLGQDQAEDRDPLDRLPRVHVVAVAELRPRARVEQVDRHRRRVDRGQLERHLDALLARLAEVQDPADAGLQPRLAHRLDRAQPALVADRGGDLGVVGARRLDVVVDALDAGVLELPARA